ncbi:MAG TPA: SH3 domain-containing protein [Kiloniellales bacterium]|nr:SH3 domain-containing protein [Kiloniellales bacterium]
MRIALLLLLSALLLATPAAAAEPLTYPPFDDAGQQPTFKTYRDKLIAAVEKRDVAAVVAMASPEVELSFGGDSGRETLRQWLSAADAEPYWESLERVLKEGGTFQEGLFIAPWTFHYVAPETMDIYSIAIVAGKNVRLRAEPSTAGKVIRALTYEVVEMPPYDQGREDRVTDPSGREWLRVRTTVGEEGWMASEFLRFLIDYRAGFQHTPQGWQMLFFVAGD